MSKPLLIMSDSSKIVASAILMQRENERADSACYVVSYASRKCKCDRLPSSASN